jgi:hypothetical protein
MESRLGGTYLTDMQQLRAMHKKLAEIVDFFLAKASPLPSVDNCGKLRFFYM